MALEGKKAVNRLGLVFGFFFYFLLVWSVGKFRNENEMSPLKVHNSSFASEGFELYESELAKNLFNEVKIVCWVLMTPKNHKTRAIHVKNTWGRRCNKLLFMSTEEDPDLPAIKLPVEDGKGHFWKKTRQSLEYVYKHHFNDGDWFLKADDDTYIVMENLRKMLHQYRPQTALFFGHRMAGQDTPSGYMQGGSYVMSKKSLTKFATKLAPNLTICGPEDGYAEDLLMGKKFLLI